MYRELRCQSCNKKLAEAVEYYGLVVKCCRCKFLNKFSIS
ncbi:Com family DNA-binding transcriptional regulator [Snodgrassella alvi]